MYMYVSMVERECVCERERGTSYVVKSKIEIDYRDGVLFIHPISLEDEEM